MEHNAEKIPAYIFDWLQKISFSQLNLSQRAEVLNHYSEEEYEAMHETVMSIGLIKQQYISLKWQRKKMLLQKFDAKHNNKPEPAFVFLKQPVALWKSAAVLILAVGSWFAYRAMRQNETSSPILSAVIDTLYLTKEVAVAPLKIYDTIYIDRPVYISRKENAVKKDQKSVRENDYAGISGEHNIGTVSVKELENVANKTRRNSMRDDSLLRRYSFVTM
jgi:hypothetical protein